MGAGLLVQGLSGGDPGLAAPGMVGGGLVNRSRGLSGLDLLARVEDAFSSFAGMGGSPSAGRRQDYRVGHYERGLVTRIGTFQLRVPQDRNGQFQITVCERYRRSEKAFAATLA